MLIIDVMVFGFLIIVVFFKFFLLLFFGIFYVGLLLVNDLFNVIFFSVLKKIKIIYIVICRLMVIINKYLWCFIISY